MEFPNKLTQFLEQDVVIGRSGREFRLGAGSMSTLGNLAVIMNVFSGLEPERTLEIGLCHGASAILFAALHEHHEAHRRECHIAMDPFQSTDWDGVGLLQIENLKLSPYVKFIEDYSFNVLPNLLKSQTSIDLIYIDGSHLFENVFVDFFYSAKLLKLGGIMMFDDSSDSHVKKVTRFIRRNFKGILQEVDLAKYRGYSGFGALKYRLARTVDRIQLTAFEKVRPDVERKWNSPLAPF
jgi:hypothetical protein